MPLSRLSGLRRYAVCLMLLPTRCGDSLQRYDSIVAESRRCAPQDQCAIAGGVEGCRCPVAVRAGAKERVDAAAREATCPQTERLYCPPLRNLRCENQRCVADELGESRAATP